MHDVCVKIGFIVLLVMAGWSLLSIVVALAIGGMAHARDEGPTPILESTLVPRRESAAAHDDDFRAAI